jgi:hypothetical protein
MTGAVSPASAAGASTVTGAQSYAVAAPNASLLPPPGALSDPLSMVAYFQSNDQQLGLDEGTKRIQGLQKETQQAFQKEQQAIADLVQAEQHKSFWDSLGGVFSEIAKVAGVVASIAAAVATCGAGSPLAAVAVAGAVMSTAGFADGELHVLQALGVSADVAGMIDVGLSIGGAATSVGAGLASGAATASSTASIVGRVAAGTAGVGMVGQGAGAIGSGLAVRDADKADADDFAAEARQSGLRRLVTQVLQQVQDANQQSSQILDTVMSTKRIEQQTSLVAAAGQKG